MQEIGASASVANCNLDVTIFLVEKSSMDEPAESNGNKRRRTSVALGQVKVKASRLRQCSTYFGTCMSERWAQSKVPNEREFHLEVHTEVRHYEDCFSRMNYLYKPIASVACCIELLKVASQVGFDSLVDICVKCLGGTAWSDEEEKLVGEFCTSAHLVPFDSLTDLLRARFHQLPLTQEEQQEKLSLSAKDLFSRYLRNALPEESLLEGKALISRKRSRTKFAQAFHVLMSDVESGIKCDEVLEHIQALLTKALANLLTRIQRELNDLPARASAVECVLSDMCWLFEVAREANAAQALVVELVELQDVSIVRKLFSAVLIGDSRLLQVRHFKQWAKIIYALFQDVLEGKLFLNSFQRSTLFGCWRWLVRDIFLGIDDEHVKAVCARIITTLPLAEQEKFWMEADIEPERGILWEAHKTWISRMVSRKVQLLQPQSTASSNEFRSKTED